MLVDARDRIIGEENNSNIHELLYSMALYPMTHLKEYGAHDMPRQGSLLTADFQDAIGRFPGSRRPGKGRSERPFIQGGECIPRCRW